MSSAAEPAVAIRCTAGHLVGIETAGVHVVRHAGRTYVGVLFSATCKCGKQWQNPTLRPLIMRALVGLPQALEDADLPELVLEAT